MRYSTKTKIAMISGIGIIVFVASLVGLPFMDSSVDVQKIAHDATASDDDAERKMLDLISHEKAEFEMKVGGKLKIP